MQSDIKLNEGTVEMTGDKVKADVGFNGGSIELNGSNLKTSVSNIEMYYYGGHLKAVGGTVQLGSTDSGTFKGFRQAKDGAVQISGEKLTADVRSAEIGARINNKFEGITLSTSGVGCYSRAFTVRNPDLQQTDSLQRSALSQSAGDELVVNANGNYKGGVKMQGSVQISGEKLTADVRSAEIGARINNKFEGVSLSTGGVGCYSRAFMVRNPDVQQTDAQQRIALYQSAADELVVNANGNYKGGVKVDGPVKMTGELTMQGGVRVNPGSKLLLLTPDKTTKLPDGKVIRIPGTALDVLETITRLQEMIVQLQNKIALLEKR